MKIDPEILKLYKPADTHFIANEEDKDLDSITVPLPKPPPLETIDGYGLHPTDQFFKKPSLPPKLVSLQDEQDDNGNYLTQDEIWDRLEQERSYYKDEIKFIKREWRRRLNGYWFFNNGKPTFITGWHYMFLVYWQIPEGNAEYRDHNRRFFLFADFIYKDPKFYGFIHPKGRRIGLTSMASCINYCIATTLIRGRTGIQSMNDKAAEDVFQKHIVPAWRSMVFFFRPNSSVSDDPKKILLFSSVATRGKLGTKKRSRKSLLTDISFRSSGAKAYDGTKLHFTIQDEIGKTVECNINDRWRTIRLCLSLGGGSIIHGFAILGSTVGEMEKGGGQNMKELCDGSKYSERNSFGQTATGLCTLFMPAYDGMTGFLDKYGMSIIDTPTHEQLEYLKSKPDYSGITIGAKQYLEENLAHLKRLGDKDGLADSQREFPTSYRGCFRTNGRDSFFNIPKIEERLDELEEMPTATIRGDFEWEGHKYRSKVRFVPNTESGKFYVSKVLSPLEANKVVWNDMEESFEPLNLKYCAGGDTFKANETKSKKNSKGAGAVYWGHDAKLDPFEKPMSEWVSARFICTYLHRPDDKEEYIEDMIMQCVYFGCPIYVETNVPDLREGFIKYGYRNMLVYKFDLTTEKFDSIAGQATNTTTKQEIFKLWQVQINRHCHREKHKDVLIQVRDIGGLDDMTHYDLFTAGGYAMKGFEQYAADLQLVTNPNQGANEGGYNLNDFFSEVNYG